MLRNYIGDNLGQRWGREFAPDDAALRALGDTEAGAAWAMKALNPSWKGVCRGMPDKTSIMIVQYNHEHTETVQIPATENTSASYNITFVFYNDLIVIADVIIASTATPDDLWMSYTILNPDIPDLPLDDPAYLAELATHDPVLDPTLPAHVWPVKVIYTTRNYLFKKAQILEQVQAVRRTHYGVTGVMNQNTQSDQGLLHGGQVTQTPRIVQVVDTASGEIIPKLIYGPEDFPTSKTITSYPRSLKTVARDGFYGQMRLDEDLDRFRNVTSPVCVQSLSTAMYPAAQTTHGWVASPKKFIAIKNGTIGTETLGNNIMTVFLSTLSGTASIDLTFRYGEEARPMERTITKPFWSESPRMDPMAMQMYSSIISEQQMDMYTADYNKWEWLTNMIAKHGPALRSMAEGAIGGMGGGLSGVLMGAANGAMQHYGGNKRRRVELVDE